MIISSISEAEEILRQYIPDITEYSKGDISLDSMWPLLELAGKPHEKLKVIHIAGTSGKTSTAYYVSALLSASGKKVGLTVSPHVDSITERVQINGNPLSDREFCNDLGEFLKLLENLKKQPSYFELLIVFVLWVFVRRGVDYAVVETGLGGLLDGSNVVTSKDKICVITDIGMDHTLILGDTLGEIAGQKAGIIHEGNTAYMYQQNQEIMESIQKRVVQKNATLEIIQEEAITLIAKNLQLALLPKFQLRNWVLAITAAQAVASRDKFDLAHNLDPLSVRVPGRMEQVDLPDSSLLIMDGAHNGQKMTVFIDSFKSLYPKSKTVVLLALKEGKEYKEVIDVLSPITQSLILTTFETSQDLRIISQDPEVIEDYAKGKNLPVKVIKDSKEAYNELVKDPAKIKIITGSFYLLGQVRKFITKK